ncbi:exonuclease V subunit gamma, partial [bacterium]|nr:exonuclease V subunit gamma [bacterium]
MSLTVYTSNRMELLADSLAETVRAPLASPLATEVIVVQSAGMQRWLSMELAARFGVWANCDYPYPNAMLRRLFRAVIPELPEACPFEPETLSWRIMGLLPELMQQPGFEAIRRYLAHEDGSLKLFQLAERIADTFDQYTLFRPQMLLGWEAGAEGGWQAALWRELAQHCGGMHRGRILEEFLRRRAPVGAQIPARIAVFGISYLPPFHLDVLAAVSRLTEVNLFLLNPCREYWATIVSERDQARLRRTARDSAPAVACLETGNALLASLGRMGRDFLDAVLERFSADIRDDFRAEPGASLLEMLRNDILNLADAPEQRLLDPADRSLQVHSCHGPLRELEVLHDNLLALFEADPTLTPRDVLVMTPDIESYAPYITAVFDAARGTGRALPHAVADRGLRSEGRVSRGLMAILSLPGGRFGANRVMDILESPPVRKRFGLEAGDLETVRRWVEETRIRWGRDEGDRLRHG